MSKLYFKVASDYQEVIRLREECKKLEDQLKRMDSTSSPASVKRLENQLSESRKQLTGLVAEAAKAGVQIEQGLKSNLENAAKAVKLLNKKVAEQQQIMRDTAAEVKRLGKAYQKAFITSPMGMDEIRSQHLAMRNALIQEQKSLFNLTQEQAQAREELARVRAEYNRYQQKADGVQRKNKEVKDSFSSMSATLGKAVGVIGGTAALKELASQIIRVRGEFQEMETSIETMVGKNTASKLLPQLKELAKISPLTMKDMVRAEKMMLGFNIAAEDTVKYLKAMSDLSMGSGAKFNSLTLAFSQMSAAGKLMGQDLNQMINAGFNPLQEISRKTGKSIAMLKEEMSKGAVSAKMVQDAFVSATEAGGKFYKMSENASKTINGQLSMMQDAMDAAFNEMGKASEGFVIKAISTTTKLIQNYETIGKVLVGLVATYGTYRAAVMLTIAADKAHALARLASIKHITKLSLAIDILTKRIAALNVMANFNPYAAIATAVIGLTSAMWMFHDSTSAAEKAQKNFNDEMDRFKKSEEDRRNRIEKLISVIKDKNETELAQVRAYEELQRLSPALTAAYTREQLATKNLANAQKELNKERDKNEYDNIIKNVNNAKERIKETKKNLEELLNTPGDHIQEIQLLGRSQSIAEADLKKWEDELKKYQELKKKTEDEAKPIEVRILEAKADLTQIEKEFKAAKDKLEEEEKKLKKNPYYVIPFYVRMQYDTKKGEMESKSKNLSTLEAKQKKETPNLYGKAYEEAKKKWQEAKKNFKEVEDDKNKFTVELYEKRKKALETAESAFKALGGDISKKVNKSLEDASKKQQEAIETQKKIAELEEKHADSLAAMYAGTENKAEKARIEAMEEGYEKVIALQNYNNRIELENIENQKNAYIQKITQSEREIFNAKERLKTQKDSKYKAKDFDPKSVNVDTSAFDTMKVDTIKRQNAEKLKAQKDAWNEYYKAYGDFQQKRKAITDIYNEKIKAASTEGDKAILEKMMADELDELDKRMKSSTSLMGQLFADSSERSVSEIQKVIDKAEKLMAYLSAVKDEQGSVKIGGEKVTRGDILNLGISENTLKNLEVAPEKLKAVQDAIKGLKNETKGRSPWKAFTKDMNEAFDTFKDAKGKKGKDKTTAIGDGISKIGKSIVEFTPALGQFGTNLGTIFGNDKLGQSIKGIASAMGGLGQTAAGVGQMMSGDIVGGAMAAVDGISSVVSSLEGLFGADYSSYNRMKEEYESLSAIWDELIDKKKEYIDISYGLEAQKSAEEAMELLRQQEAYARKLAEERKRAGSSAGSHSIAARQNKNLGGYASELYKYVAQNGNYNDITNALLGASADQLRQVKENMWAFWNGLDGEFQKALDDIIAADDAMDDLNKSLKNAVTGVSFESFRDSFVDSLLDMESSAEDFANNLESQIQNAVIRSMVANKFEGEIKALYELWNTLGSDGNLSSDDAVLIRERQKKITEQLLKEREGLKEAFGWGEIIEEEQDSEIKGLKDLQKAYDNLNESVSHAYSSEKVEVLNRLNKNLKDQLGLIQERIRLEEQKPDANAEDLEEWSNQLEDINKQIEKNKEAVKDAIFGEDLQSAIGDFVNAFTGALENGDTSSVAKNYVNNMVRSMVVESMKAEVAPMVEVVRNKLIEAWEDGMVSSDEQVSIEDLVGEMNEALQTKYEWADNLFKETSSEIAGLEELQEAYSDLSDTISKTYSNERVNILKEQIKLQEEQKKLIEERIAVEKNTESLEGYESQLKDINKQIEANKEAMKDAIFGSDIQNSINSFVSAYTDALGSGDMTGVSQSVIDNMIKSMVIESMKADASPVAAAVREKLIESWKDGVISSDEQSEVKGLIDALYKELGDKYNWADDLFKVEETSSEIVGLKELQDAYDSLADSVNKVYSTERVELMQEQINNLERQRNLIQSSISTSSDQDLINSWSEQLNAINKQIADTKESQIDAIFGSDTQSAINSFADAFIDAWARGEDKAKSTKDVVKSIIRSMVVESMKMDISPFVDKMREQLTEMYKDGVITSDESSVISGMVQSMVEQLEKQYEWADQFIKEEKEVIEESIEEIQETFSGMTFESMRDDFISQLSNIESSYEDMCRNFEDRLRQSIIKGFIESKYKNQIQGLIDEWDRYGEGGNLNKNEVDNLRNQYQDLVQDMIKDRDDLAKQMGWDTFQQNASSKGFSTMSQSTGEELNGRFTAMYESDLRREKIQSEQLALMRSMSGVPVQTPITDLSGPVGGLLENGQRVCNIADDTRTILANSYVELQQIRENTGAIVKPIKQMQADIAEVKRNTEKL